MIGAPKLGGDIIIDGYCYKYGFHRNYPSLRVELGGELFVVEIERMRQEQSSLGRCRRTRIDERKQTDRGMKE